MSDISSRNAPMSSLEALPDPQLRLEGLVARVATWHTIQASCYNSSVKQSRFVGIIYTLWRYINRVSYQLIETITFCKACMNIALGNASAASAGGEQENLEMRILLLDFMNQILTRKIATMRYVMSALALAGAFIYATSASATVIISPIGSTQNTMGEFNSSFDVGNLFDQSGLSAGFTSGVTDFNTYVAATPTHTQGFTVNLSWAGNIGSLTGIIDFDLGQSLLIEQLAIWQGATQSQLRGLNSITLFTSNTATFSTATNVGSFNVTQASVPPTAAPVEVFDITDSVGQYVRLQINSNHGSSIFTQWGEIAFGAQATVPEPTTLTLFGLGLAGLVFARKKKA